MKSTRVCRSGVACVPASSFDSKRSASGIGPASAASDFAMLSLPQPLYKSRSGGQGLQPVAALTSSAKRVRMCPTWSGWSRGRAASRSAAAAATCGAAKDVPSALRYSSGPQIE